VHTLGDDEELLQVGLRLSLRRQLEDEAGGAKNLLSSAAKPEVSRHTHDADVNAEGQGDLGGPGLSPPATEGEAQRALKNRCMQDAHHGLGVPEENEEILGVVGVGDERPLLKTKATKEVGVDVPRGNERARTGDHCDQCPLEGDLVVGDLGGARNDTKLELRMPCRVADRQWERVAPTT
jgi:hypothetical protein